MLLFSCMHVEKNIVIVFHCCLFLVRRSHKTARNRCCVTTLITYLKVRPRLSFFCALLRIFENSLMKVNNNPFLDLGGLFIYFLC